ncbi:MAG TPA: DUF5916 domain-containing protein [Thermoanaerobaculia bacterium]|jgi:hypothetical protein|nr:DUF5916 domain-containing protein [Thermoanaerobaculia bacterium]
MLRCTLPAFVAGFAFTAFTAAVAQQPPAAAADGKTFTVPSASSPVKVDGVLDEPAWEGAVSVPIAYEWTPGDNTPPPVPTEALLTYDRDNLYVAFRAHDPEPGKIRAHLMDRDSINTFVQDDHVLLLLDTFNDERRAYQFRINPLGVQADALNSEVLGSEDWSFDLIWSSAGRIGEDGYVVEVAIPFKQIRFPGTSGEQTWGIELGRSWPRNQRHRMSDHMTDRNRGCGFCQFNKYSGFSGLRPGRNLELDPTLTGRRTDTRTPFPAGDLDAGKEKLEGGLTARWGVTPNVSVGAAANPDFSQVEADAAQLAVNERFALFFPEKRPFFLEGSDFFATPIQAVFTRTVVDPQWGLKATGKVGPHAGGVFVTQDHVNSFLIPSNQSTDFGFLDQQVTAGVLRYRRDVLKRSTVGVLYAGRQGHGGYHNRVAGLDGFFNFSDTDNVSVQYLRSDTGYPRAVAADFGQPLGSFRGDGWEVAYNHFSRNWVGNLFLQDLNEGFRADSGFVPRVDVRTADGTLIRRFWPRQGARWTRLDLGAELLRSENHHGDLTDEGEYLFGTFLGPWQSTAGLTLGREKTLFGARLYEGLDWWRVNLSAQPTGVVKLDLTARRGETIDFDNNRPADEVRLLPAVELKLGSHLNTQLSHSYHRLDVLGGKQLVSERLTQLRAVYNFNVRSFVRAILQYRDVQQNPALYVFPVRDQTQTLFSQLLFSYKLNPQTVLFVGYSDNSLGFEQATRTVDLTRRDRTFFVKLGYAFLF